MTISSVNISLKNDNISERVDEEFLLMLNVSLFDGRITPSDHNTARGLITDTTSKC